MIRFIIFVILCYILYRLVKNLFLTSSTKPEGSSFHPHETITDEMVRDPICHVYIPKRDAVSAQVAGETVYFCSKECKKKYLEEKSHQSLHS